MLFLELVASRCRLIYFIVLILLLNRLGARFFPKDTDPVHCRNLPRPFEGSRAYFMTVESPFSAVSSGKRIPGVSLAQVGFGIPPFVHLLTGPSQPQSGVFIPSRDSSTDTDNLNSVVGCFMIRTLSIRTAIPDFCISLGLPGDDQPGMA